MDEDDAASVSEFFVVLAGLRLLGPISPYWRTSPFIDHIPGEPAVSLRPSDVRDYLTKQLEVLVLDELYDKLWLFARKSGQSIDPLYAQKVKGRDIVPTEDARLHLVWGSGKIYIKPVPVFLLNYEFWTTYLQSPTSKERNSESPQSSDQSGSSGFDCSIAVGFLRSYALLVQNRLDFALAKEAHLMPDDVENWLQWSKFIRHFGRLTDERVSRRYHYGQLRLSRLNWAVRILRPKTATTWWFYEVPYWVNYRIHGEGDRAVAFPLCQCILGPLIHAGCTRRAF